MDLNTHNGVRFVRRGHIMRVIQFDGQAITPESRYSVEIFGGRNDQIPERRGKRSLSRWTMIAAPNIRDEETRARRHLTRAAELRALATKTDDPFRRDLAYRCGGILRKAGGRRHSRGLKRPVKMATGDFHAARARSADL